MRLCYKLNKDPIFDFQLEYYFKLSLKKIYKNKKSLRELKYYDEKCCFASIVDLKRPHELEYLDDLNI